MGKTLADSFPEAARVFQEADDALGFPLSRLCFEGPDDQLKLTENTQPALLTVSVAAHAVLVARGSLPRTWRATAWANTPRWSPPDLCDSPTPCDWSASAANICSKRFPPAWARWRRSLSFPAGKLEAVLAEAAQGEIVTAANLNSPDQIVIAGHTAAVNRAIELAKAAGARRAVLLPVSAPFHCPLLKPAQDRLKPDLDATEFRDLTVPLINNWQAREVRTGAEAREGLYQQIPNPVRWSESIALLASRGVTRFIEVGAGAVLTGLLKNIDPALTGLKFGEASDWEKL